MNVAELKQSELMKLATSSGVWLKVGLTKSLFTAKNNIGKLGDAWYKLRDSIFPNMASGGGEVDNTRVSNRAGLKLNEILNSLSIHLPSHFTFVDLCGAPGSFSELLLSRGAARGVAISIESGPHFYNHLQRNKRISLLTGDVCDHEVVNEIVELVGSNVDVVADGGFEVSELMINYQDLLCVKLILSELAIAAKLLKHDGLLILKLFSTATDASTSIIYLLCSLFDRVSIVKPPTSRITNSERYAACSGYRKVPELSALRRQLIELLEFEDAPLPANDLITRMRRDTIFKRSLRVANEELAIAQLEAIQKILNTAMLNTEKLSNSTLKTLTNTILFK